MYWSYTGQAQTVVPSTSLYYPTYIASSPIQVTVTCPSGYTKTTSGGYPTCVTTWGDGYRVGSETCDDGNTTPNDGCSASCAVESGYTWSGGSGTSKDTWSKISTSTSSTSTTSTTTTSPVYTLTSTNRWMALSVWIAFWIWFVLDLIIWWVTEKYPSGLYIWLEHIQLITILPLTGSYFTAEVNGFFRLMRFSLLGFDFINFKEVFDIHLDYGQDNAVLSFLGFGSSSTILNIASYLMIILCITLSELMIFKLNKFVNQRSSLIQSNLYNRINNSIRSLSRWMTFGAYIRYFILGFALINISSLNELNNYSIKEYRWSWCFALLILFAWSLFICSIILTASWIWSFQYLFETRLFKELVNGMKSNKSSKFYIFLFLIHRMLIIMLFISNLGLEVKSKFILVICIQFIYLLYWGIFRPFDSFKANLIKLICEAWILSIFWLSLSHIDFSGWGNSTSHIFLYLMIISSWVPLFINFSKYIIKIYSFDHSIIIFQFE